MKKYQRLICTVCKRTKDAPVDNTRVVPDRCTITLNCQGRLVLTEYRSNAEIAVAPEVGITDWYPRNRTVTATVADTEPTLVNTSTGTYQQLVLGLALASPPTDAATAALQLTLRDDTPKNYRQYTYRFDTTFQNVAGVEDGLEKKTLRYTAYGVNPDLVEVYVNGVKKEQFTDYQLYDGTPSSTVPPNIISFNVPQTVSGTAQVDVIVSKAAVLNTTTLTFFRNTDNEARRDKGAWENVSYLDRLVGGVWKRFYLFTYDVSTSVDLTLNTIMIPSTPILVTDVVPASVQLSDSELLLARKPYTQLDRYPDIAAKLSDFSIERDFFKYHTVSGVPTLELTDTTLTTFYPPARLTKFQTELTIKTATAGVDEQVVKDGQVVVGPDE